MLAAAASAGVVYNRADDCINFDAIASPGELRFVLINTGTTGGPRSRSRPRRSRTSEPGPVIALLPPPPHGCNTPAPRVGFYSNAGPEAAIVVNPTPDIYLMCHAGHRYVSSISGESTYDGTLFGAGIDLGQPGAWVQHSYRSPGELHGNRFAFSYTAESAHIHLAGSFAASSVAGTVDYRNTAACGRPPVVHSFSLTRRSGL